MGDNLTLFLRGIDPKELGRKYSAGNFIGDLVPPDKVILGNGIIDTFTTGSNPNGEFFEYPDRDGYYQLVVRTGHKRYVSIQENTTPPTIPCFWCRRMGNDGGIIIRMEWDFGINKFYTEGGCCTFECGLAYLEDEETRRPMGRDALYSSAIPLINRAFSLVYPHDKLSSSADWRLLCINGGPLTEKQFFHGTHRFQRTPNVIFYPSRIEYLATKVNQSY